jgi:tetratricopeptide (TPR) repeat protein
MRRALLAIVLLVTASAMSAADRPWTIVHSRNLAVIGELPSKTLAGIALELEQFRTVLGGLISNAQRPLPAPTRVYVFATRKEMEPFLPLYNGKPGSMAGYFQHDEEVNDIALSLEGYEESARIVFHEYTHLLLKNAARSLPLWLDEGLAEYYSTYALEKDGTRAHIGRPVVADIALLNQRWVPLSELIAADYRSPMYNERDRQGVFYAEVWALTHYLMVEAQNGPLAINRYAAGIAKGGKPADVFVEAFGKTPAAFEKELRTYLHGVGFKSTYFGFKERIDVAAPDPGRALSAAEAAAWLGDLQRRIGRRDEAAPRIANALATGPDAAMPQLAAAWLRLDEKKPDEAWPAFERATTLAPDDFSAQFAYGVALLRHEAREGRYAGNAAVDRARVALAKATAINPASSDAFAWLAYAQMLTEGKLPEAVASIRQAMELAPGRLDYLLRYADIFILANALTDARTILTDISRVPTDPAAGDAAKRRLEQIDEREARMREYAGKVAAYEEARRAAEAVAAEERKPGSSVREVDPEPPDTVRIGAARIRLRAVQRGEERAYGDLVDLECGAAEVRVHLKVGSRTIIATARRMEDITLTEFLGDKTFTVKCGARETPDAVYLTWRSLQHRIENGARIVGTAVALEFVPRGYAP